jgi:hypothetical protein
MTIPEIAKQTKKNRAVVFKRIKGEPRRGERGEGLEPNYVVAVGRKSWRGREFNAYGLTFQGVLAGLVEKLYDNSAQLICNTRDVNPFLKLAKAMLDEGVEEKIVEELFLTTMRDAVLKGGLSVEHEIDEEISTLLLYNLVKRRLFELYDQDKLNEDVLRKMLKSLDRPEAVKALYDIFFNLKWSLAKVEFELLGGDGRAKLFAELQDRLSPLEAHDIFHGIIAPQRFRRAQEERRSSEGI